MQIFSLRNTDFIEMFIHFTHGMLAKHFLQIVLMSKHSTFGNILFQYLDKITQYGHNVVSLLNYYLYVNIIANRVNF